MYLVAIAKQQQMITILRIRDICETNYTYYNKAQSIHRLLKIHVRNHFKLNDINT